VKLPRLILVSAWLCLVFTTSAAPAGSLEAGFQNPPASARPQTWWHWMNGNITREGITADLEAMKNIGLGGATIVNVDCGIPPGPVKFMSPEWRADFKFAVSEANRLGLELCVENCAGWSSSGGPWNTVTNAMQQVTTSEVRVTGPTNFNTVLPQPPTKLGFYRDIAVLAFPLPDARATIENIQAKAGFNGDAVFSSTKASSSTNGAISRRNVVDLTSKLTADGKLRWQAPAGEWLILRVGYTPTGVNNHPAAYGGEGLECDKFSKAALDAHWDGFMQKILDDLGPLAGRTLDSSLIDSYEVGGQNWSKNFREEFEKRRDYDLLKFLPAFTGRIVDNPEVSERFLWDIRRTIADLFAENYYGHFAELCRRHGLKNAVEPYTGPFESLQCGAPADVVMGEFWSGSQGNPSVKMAASIAHIYGKTIVGAESFTAAPGAQSGRWQEDPYSLKTLGDLMYCEGLNRYVFHRYAMQPWTNRWPGMTMGQWGFHFERTETWWNQGKPWIDYISHCQFLLQQGRAVADAAYFTGESVPVEMRAGDPPLPAGYDYDAINADVLMHNSTVKNGRITLASGASYAVLILPPKDANMTPQTLQRLCELVRAGATVVGPRPQHSPSLAGFPKCDAQVEKIAREMWGQCDGSNVLENADGKGRVAWGRSLADVFAAQNLQPDFEFQGANTHLTYAHRMAGAADIYFVSNQRRQFDSAECTFRVSGKVPELWHPDTGVIETAPVWSVEAGRTKVHLDFEPAGSVFVIFRHAIGNADHVMSVSGNFPVPASATTTPKLEIKHAVYASIDSTNETDVTAKLSELAKEGQVVIAASNDAMGRDPSYNHAKELRVDYNLDGKLRHATVQENDLLTLPATAAIGQAPQWEMGMASDGLTIVKVWCNGQVERRIAGGKHLHGDADMGGLIVLDFTNVPAPQEISGGWNLSFPPHWGAPPSVELEKLISWPDHTNDGVRYFSGTATYEKKIEIPADRLHPDCELWLDLGAVKNFAEVSLNGKDLGVLWKPPFRVNITSVAKPGVNKLEIKVTNLWPNRLIGDEHLPPDCEWDDKQIKAWPQWLLDGLPSPTGRLTFTTWHHWSKDSPLLESGLLGPVTLRTAEIIPAD